MNEMMGIINLSASGEKLKQLTENRAVGSIPIGGRYRVVDFILSNMVNSGITDVSIGTQDKSRALYEHLDSGKYWDLDRKTGGLYVYHPEASSVDIVQKKGDIEVIGNMLSHLRKSKQEYILLSRSYMICNVNYSDFLEHHKSSGADISIMYKRMNNNVKRFIDCDTLNFSDELNIASIGKNLGKKKYYNVSMEMYLIKRELFIDIVEDTIHDGSADYLKQAIFSQIEKLNVVGYPFEGYLSCINTLENYYKTNMEMLNIDVQKELFNEDGLIYTKIADGPPSFYGDDAYVTNSLISSGCKIEGIVENSVLSRDVHVKKGAIVRDCVLLRNSVIGETANIENMILDRDVTISEKKTFRGDYNHPFVIEKGSKV